MTAEQQKQALARALAWVGGNQSELARQIGCTRAMVCYLAAGDRPLSKPMARKVAAFVQRQTSAARKSTDGGSNGKRI